MASMLDPYPILLIPEMFKGANEAAFRATFQKFARPGVIIAGLRLEVDADRMRRTVIVTYVLEREGKMSKQFDPNSPRSNGDDFRVHEFPAHEFRIRTDCGSMYMDPLMVLSKLALIGG